MTLPNQSRAGAEPFDFLVFIGRFQPFHNGHLAIIQAGLAQSRYVIVLCGSAHQPRTLRNPWLVQEREQMIRASVSKEDNQRLMVAPLMDALYNDEGWVRSVQSTVNGFVTAYHGVPHRQARIGLIGHKKDHTSYYLNLFPQWEEVGVENRDKLSATPLREAFFTAIDGEYESTLTPHLPEGAIQVLHTFRQTEAFTQVREEHAFIQSYQQAWSAAPYPVTFVTVDAVVVQSGHVLLVERKARPGKGLLALPGGFVDSGEKLVDACIRELREETRLKVPGPVLKGSIRKASVFDDPHRSARGRTITHAYHIELAPSSVLPKVKGGDDARKALWVPLADIQPETMFEDHYFIIQEMLGM